jgi:hypothetical protein
MLFVCFDPDFSIAPTAELLSDQHQTNLLRFAHGDTDAQRTLVSLI